MLDKEFQVAINIRGRSLFKLKDFLLAHEDHIACDIGSYNNLYNIFVDIIEREPIEG